MSNLPQPVPTDLPKPHGNAFDTTNANGTSNDTNEARQRSSPPPGEGYPEQKHAGAVGYGPEYHKGPGVGTQFQGLYEVAKGKVTRNPGQVEHGRALRTGDLARQERQSDGEPDPFGGQDDQAAYQQAATEAPEGTETASVQGQGTHDLKHIGS